MPEPVPPAGQRLLVGLQQVDDLADQVVEVQAAGPAQHLLVPLVDAAHHLVVVVAVRVALRPHQLVLRPGDRVRDHRRRVLLGVEPQLLHRPLQRRAAVVLVEDRERARQADPVRVPPQHPHRRGVEGANPHLLRARDEPGDPLPHLPGRLVRERDGQEPVRPDPALRDQVRDPRRQHPRLAAAGPREDQERALQVGHGLALRGVQGRDQLVQRGALELRRGHETVSLRGHLHPHAEAPPWANFQAAALALATGS